MVFMAPLMIVVLTGTPVTGFTPATTLVTRAAGLPPINTVGLPMVIDPWHAAPATMSPITEAGIFSMSTVGTPGPVMVSPVAVVSVKRAAGKGIFASLLINLDDTTLYLHHGIPLYGNLGICLNIHLGAFQSRTCSLKIQLRGASFDICGLLGFNCAFGV